MKLQHAPSGSRMPQRITVKQECTTYVVLQAPVDPHTKRGREQVPINSSVSAIVLLDAETESLKLACRVALDGRTAAKIGLESKKLHWLR
jgi:hypothetical protein